MTPGTTTVAISLRLLNRIRKIGIFAALAATATIAFLVTRDQDPQWATAVILFAIFVWGAGVTTAAVTYFLVPSRYRG